ncbi:MAG: hypothetical protein HY326_06550, partial [Chloroflexi bacterium]|nr:hypothetical protein [Chloroflexota bacterium]
LPRGSSTPAKTVTASIGPGTSKTWDLNSNDFIGLPNTGQDLGVPTGFLGAASITADKPIVVQAFTDITGSKAVGGFSGVPASSASTTLYAPLIRRNFFGTTGLQIVNLNASPANVTVSYNADPSSPTGGNYTDNVTIQANSSQAIYHGSSAQTHVPDRWFGNAIIQSNVPVVAMVNDSSSSGANMTAGSYNVPTQADASTKVALPLVRRKHTSGQLTTGVQVMNVGASAANITIQFTGWDGAAAGSLTQNNVPVNGAVNWYQAHPSSPVPTSGRPEGGWYGSAVITSSQPVVVIVNDASDINALDSAIYNGLPSQ